ncbi:hypothetical protein ABVT39_009327 [Epinephelus coioides]
MPTQPPGKPYALAVMEMYFKSSSGMCNKVMRPYSDSSAPAAETQTLHHACQTAADRRYVLCGEH